MKSLKFCLLLYTTTTIVITLSHLLSPIVCINHNQPWDTSRVKLLFEEKKRLGSTPPSCHNKCNQCHPCMAVQIPTLLSHNRIQPGLNRVRDNGGHYDSSKPLTAANYKYSNYKPIGWKCSCDDHFFSP